MPVVYGFVIVNLLLFYVAFAAGVTAVIAAAFFIWLSAFNLIVVSLFWSNVSDAFTTEQSHRLYGYIFAGGTAGALAGPALTALLARYLSSAHLLALSALLLAAAAGVHGAAPPCAPASRSRRRPRPIGGSVLAGIPLTLEAAQPARRRPAGDLLYGRAHGAVRRDGGHRPARPIPIRRSAPRSSPASTSR